MFVKSAPVKSESITGPIAKSIGGRVRNQPAKPVEVEEQRLQITCHLCREAEEAMAVLVDNTYIQSFMDAPELKKTGPSWKEGAEALIENHMEAPEGSCSHTHTHRNTGKERGLLPRQKQIQQPQQQLCVRSLSPLIVQRLQNLPPIHEGVQIQRADDGFHFSGLSGTD